MALDLAAEALKREAETKGKEHPRVLVIKKVFAGAGKQVYDEKYFKANHKEYQLPFDRMRCFIDTSGIANYVMVNKNPKLVFPIGYYNRMGYGYGNLVIWELEIYVDGARTVWLILEKTK